MQKISERSLSNEELLELRASEYSYDSDDEALLDSHNNWKRKTLECGQHLYVFFKYIVLLYVGPLLYGLSHEFGHAVTAWLFKRCNLNVHLGCLDECTDYLFSITNHFTFHTIIPFYGYAITDDGCTSPLTVTEEVFVSIGGSFFGLIQTYLFFSIFFAVFKWNHLKNVKMSLKYGFTHAITPFANIKNAIGLRNKSTFDLVYTPLELYLCAFMFGIAMLANFDRILYGILPTCGFSFIPYYLWEDPSTSIWGDGADVWRLLGADNTLLIVGTSISFVLNYVARILVIRKVVILMREIYKRHNDLHI